MTTDDAPSPSGDTPPPRIQTVAPVTRREAVRRLGLLAGSAAVLVMGARLMQPGTGLTSEGLWGALLGDPWVIGGIRFVGAATATFLLASILVLTHRGRWIDRAGGVQVTSPVQTVWDRVAVLEDELAQERAVSAELFELLDAATAPDRGSAPDGSPPP